MKTIITTGICSVFLAVCLTVSGLMAATNSTSSDFPSPKARQVSVEIRRQAALEPNGPSGRPLPLVSHWNTGSQGRGWTPQYQVELLDRGCHILPWFAWPRGDSLDSERNTKRFHGYYDASVIYCRKLGMPVCFLGTQWEAILLGKEYLKLPAQKCPAVIDVNDKLIHELSPFGPIDPWRDPAKVYVDTPAMKELQRMYPEPPLVLFISDNEAPDLRWNQVEQSKRYLDKYGKERSDSFKRQVVAEGWMKRYPVMFKAMRDALVSEAWKKNVRFVGYEAFGPSHFGRWSGWKEYSLITDKWTCPDWYIWDGGSPSYYTHNWNDNRDHWVWSTQVQSMNWIFQLDEAWKANPDFWWEISLWDGNASDWTTQTDCTPEMIKKSKACQYIKDGQTYTPQRYLGWVQFGMWLLRPRVVREFRGSTTPLEPWRPFFEQLLFAVDRIYADPTLKEFWRFGRLVPNRAHQHPYQQDIPEKYRNVDRWFLLDTNLDPPQPWELKTNIPVFSLALVQNKNGSRRWLVYAHSPLEDRHDVTIDVPGFGKVTINVPRAGTFYLIEQRDRKVTPIAPSHSGKS